MQFVDEIPVFGEPIPDAVAQIRRTLEGGADRVALMADHHKGYGVPVGGVVASRDKVCIAGVGFDIACGNKAVLTDARYQDLAANLATIMDDLVATLAFGLGRKNPEPVDHALFDDPLWSDPFLATLKDEAAAQLGTIGGGNHYVDLFRDEEDRVWVGCHFGSRGFGHKVASHYMVAAGENVHIMDGTPVFVPASSPVGADYLAAMELAGRYAYAGRDWVCDRVVRQLGAKVLDEVHNHHNFCWREDLEGEPMYVVRKGATPAFPGQRGFVGASMGGRSVILEGVAHEHATLALNSTVHGAGRLLSRTQAAGKTKWQNGRPVRVKPGLIDYDEVRQTLLARGIEIRGGGADEAPAAYKNLDEVLAHHAGTIHFLHRLDPIGVAMAGEHEFDPYKD